MEPKNSTSFSELSYHGSLLYHSETLPLASMWIKMPHPQQLRKALPLTVSPCLSEFIPWSISTYSVFSSQPPVKVLPGLTDVVTKCNTFVEVQFMAHSRTKFVQGSESETRESLHSPIADIRRSFCASDYRQVGSRENLHCEDCREKYGKQSKR